MGLLKAFVLVIGLLLFGGVAFVLSVLAFLVNSVFPRFKRNLNTIFIFMFGTFARTVVGIKVTMLHRERLFLHRPMIFFGNHQSGLDLAIIGTTTMEGAVVVGKKEIKNIPFFGWYWALAGNLLIDRKNGEEARAQIRAIREKLVNENLNLAIFPEGTRSKDGHILPFKKGVFYLAVSTGLPMIPIVCSKLSGKAVWEKFELAGGNIIVSVMEPIETKDLKMEDLDAFKENVRSKMIAEYERINALAIAYDEKKAAPPASCC